MVFSYLFFYSSIAEATRITYRTNFGEAAPCLMLFKHCFKPTAQLHYFTIPSRFYTRNIKEASACAIYYFVNLPVSIDIRVAITCNWVNSFVTSLSPLSSKSFSTSVILNCWIMIIPSTLYEIYSSVMFVGSQTSLLIGVGPYWYLFPLKLGTYYVFSFSHIWYILYLGHVYHHCHSIITLLQTHLPMRNIFVWNINFHYHLHLLLLELAICT